MKKPTLLKTKLLQSLIDEKDVDFFFVRSLRIYKVSKYVHNYEKIVLYFIRRYTNYLLNKENGYFYIRMLHLFFCILTKDRGCTFLYIIERDIK